MQTHNFPVLQLDPSHYQFNKSNSQQISSNKAPYSEEKNKNVKHFQEPSVISESPEIKPKKRQNSTEKVQQNENATLRSTLTQKEFSANRINIDNEMDLIEEQENCESASIVEFTNYSFDDNDMPLERISKPEAEFSRFVIDISRVFHFFIMRRLRRKRRF